MATYVIGDVQGCFDELQQLLFKINYRPNQDCLWFTGDLINRGPHSLQTLRFIKNLSASTICVLGNHDLALLAVATQAISARPQDTFMDILTANDCAELLDWLRQRPMLHRDSQLGFTLTHAGVYPWWSIKQASQLAQEVEAILRSSQMSLFMRHLYGNEPKRWNENLASWDRLRFICNALTRMRLVTKEGELILDNTSHSSQHSDHIPWFMLRTSETIHEKIIFGHWAALQGQCAQQNIFAIDTGCVWGNCLTAFCLETQQRFAVKCQSYQPVNDI